MKPGSWIPLAASALAAAVACNPLLPDENNCTKGKSSGDKWCEGNVVMTCYCDSSGVGSVYSCDDEAFLSCDDYGATCVELGERRAACELSGAECPEGVPSICVGDLIADCEEFGTPLLSVDCPASPPENYCVFSESANQAFCALSPDPCAPDGSEICIDQDQYWTCEYGFWLEHGWCEQPGEVCTEHADGGVTCE